MNFQGHTTQVVNGVAEDKGKKVFVSADGAVVWDESGKILGSLDAQGNFTPTNAQHIAALQQAGVIPSRAQGQGEAATPPPPAASAGIGQQAGLR